MDNAKRETKRDPPKRGERNENENGDENENEGENESRGENEN